MSFPDKAEREKCYAVRNNYWKCLDQRAPTYIPYSGADEPEVCREFRNLYEAGCRKQWLDHFEQRRAYEQSKKIKIQKLLANK